MKQMQRNELNIKTTAKRFWLYYILNTPPPKKKKSPTYKISA